ncbi:hypothetical protein [Natronococcus pandeyae]|nr:hypothetical protein [Natronococcus pandeyae]
MQPQTISGAVAAVDEETSNETVRHQNPDEYDGEADDDELESWLSDQLASQLGDSTIALSEGEYDQARDLVGEEYDDRLEQYVEVAGETDSAGTDEESNETVEAYESAAEEQEQLADRVEEYRETKAEYEAALEAGEEERAHELARDLEELYEEIDGSSDTLITSYEHITLETDEDLSEATETVDETRSEIEDEQTVVRDQQFVETALHVETDDETVSFSDPLAARGELRTADGSTIESEEIQLRVEGEPVTVDSEPDNWWSDDANSGFELEYRPTALDLATETVTVEYVPESDSDHLSSEAELDVAIEQEEPTISDVRTTGEVAYGDSLWVGGEIAVDGIPVDDVPLEVSVDGEVLGTLNATDGTFQGTGEVPASVSDGTQTVRISLPFEDQALATTTAESSLTVTETETDLALEATAVGEDELALEGQFETTGGDGLEGEPIQIQVDGTTTETVTTDADGEFAGTITTPSTADENATVIATYEGAGTSLAGATTETTVAMPSSGSGFLDGIPSTALTVLGALLAVVAIIAIGWWRRRRSETHQPEPGITGDGSPTDDRQGAGPTGNPHALVDALVAQASEQLAAGRADSAVRSCYAAVRYAHGTDPDDGGLTHWEFYRRHSESARPETEPDELRELIETYEQAAFTPTSVSESVARHVLERTQQLCEATKGDAIASSGSPQPSDD